MRWWMEALDGGGYGGRGWGRWTSRVRSGIYIWGKQESTQKSEMGNGNLVQPPDKEEEKKVSRQGKGNLFLHNDSVHDF